MSENDSAYLFILSPCIQRIAAGFEAMALRNLKVSTQTDGRYLEQTRDFYQRSWRAGGK